MSIHHLSRGSHLGGCDLAARPLRRLPINKCDLEKTTLTCFSLVSGISRDCGGGDRSCTWHGRHDSPMHRTRGRSQARRPSRLEQRDAARRAGAWASVMPAAIASVLSSSRSRRARGPGARACGRGLRARGGGRRARGKRPSHTWKRPSRTWETAVAHVKTAFVHMEAAFAHAERGIRDRETAPGARSKPLRAHECRPCAYANRLRTRPVLACRATPASARMSNHLHTRA